MKQCFSLITVLFFVMSPVICSPKNSIKVFKKLERSERSHLDREKHPLEDKTLVSVRHLVALSQENKSLLTLVEQLQEDLSHVIGKDEYASTILDDIADQLDFLLALSNQLEVIVQNAQNLISIAENILVESEFIENEFEQIA